MILYVENPKESSRKQLELMNEFQRLQDTRSIYKNQLSFYIVAISKPKMKLRKNNSINKSIKKRIMYNKSCEKLILGNYKTLLG